MRARLQQWMVESKDHLLPVFQNRKDPEFRENYVLSKEKESVERRTKKRKGQPTPRKKQRKLISLELPEKAILNSVFVVTVRHQLTKKMGEQSVHVTLKEGSAGRRLERKVIQISGTGTQEVKFELPKTVKDRELKVAAFVGASYQENLQHVTSKAIEVYDN